MKTIKYLNFQLKLKKKAIIGWSIGIFSFMFLYMILFPMVNDIAQAELEYMPTEVLELFNMSEFNDMKNYVSYFSLIFNLVIIPLSGFAANLGANLIIREEKCKTIEFLNSLELSRIKIFLIKLLSGIIILSIILLSATIASIIPGYINAGDTFILEDLLKIITIMSFTPFFFLILGFSFGGFSAKLPTPTLATISVFISYLLGYLGTLLGKDGKFLKYLSLFQILNNSDILKLDFEVCLTIVVYFILGFILLFSSIIRYKKRDFVI